MFSKKKVDPKPKKKTADKSNAKNKKVDRTPLEKPATNASPQRVEPESKPEPDKFKSGRIPSNVKPLAFSDEMPDKPIVKPPRKYPNREAHKEYQDINLTAGYHSALMKQLEIQEELTRALIDIQIAGLPDTIKEEMLKKYPKSMKFPVEQN